MDLSEIGHSKLQGICDTLSEKVSCGISIMDTDGFIIASSRKDRIGSRHEAAAEVLKGRFDVTGEMENASSVMLEGCNLPLEFRGQRIGNIGVAAELQKAQDFAEIIKTCIEFMIDCVTLQNEQQEIENRFSLAMRGPNEGLWDWDPNTKELIISGRLREILGRGQDTVYTTTHEWLGWIHPDDRSAYESELIRHLKGETEHFEHEYRVKNWQDEYVWVLARGIARFDENGKAVRMVGSIGDITKRKEEEVELRASKEIAERASRAKSEFLAHMSHELRTPLNAIIGFSQLMAYGTFGTLEGKNLEYTHDIHSSADHLLELINDILDISKIEADEFDLNEEVIDLFTPLEEALKIIRLKSAEKRQTLEFNDDARPCHVFADARLIRQIAVNLLSNAVKFTPEGGHIQMSVSREEDSGVEITISDTGIGIADEDIATILEPFGQARENSEHATEGTGLGLSLSNKLIELHEGSLLIHSTPDVGTTVTMKLPRERIREN